MSRPLGRAVETIAYGPSLWPRLEPAWIALCDRLRPLSPFLSAEWTGCWVEAYGPGARPEGLVWRNDQGIPVACALLSIGPGRRGPFRVGQAFLNASGPGPPGCEHNEILADLGVREEVWSDFIRVVQAKPGVDQLALSGATAELARGFVERWPVRRSRGYLSESPFVPLQRLRAEGRDFLSSLSSNTRAQVRRSTRLYEELFGPLAFDVTTDRSRAATWLGDLVDLHQRRWLARGHPGAFSGREADTFHAALVDRCVGASDSSRLRVEIARVRAGDETIGFLYNLAYRSRITFYQSGFRYSSDNRLKPGLVAHWLAIEHYLNAGMTEYDFLGGEPQAVQYKRSLAEEVRELAWIELPLPGLKMRLLDALAGLRRRGASVSVARR